MAESQTFSATRTQSSSSPTLWPKGIIDPLEMIEIEKYQGNFGLLTLSGCQQLGKAVTQQTPVRQAGQHVVIGQFANPLFGGLLGRNVEHRTDQCRLTIELGRRTEDHCRKSRTILADYFQFAMLAADAAHALLHLLKHHRVMNRSNHFERPHAANQLFGAETESARKTGIDVLEQPVLQHKDANLGCIHRRLEQGGKLGEAGHRLGDRRSDFTG